MHPKMEGFAVTKIGNDPGSFERTCDVVAKGRSASCASLLMINPLDPRLPAIATDCFPTCNSFDAEFVAWHWKMATGIVNKRLQPLGLKVLGCASDGDARRFKQRKLDMAKENVPSAKRKWAGVHPLFDCCCTIDPDDVDGSPLSLHSQDPFHVAKNHDN